MLTHLQAAGRPVDDVHGSLRPLVHHLAADATAVPTAAAAKIGHVVEDGQGALEGVDVPAQVEVNLVLLEEGLECLPYPALSVRSDSTQSGPSGFVRITEESAAEGKSGDDKGTANGGTANH